MKYAADHKSSYHSRIKVPIFCGALLLLGFFLHGHALAANSASIIDAGTGIGGAFDADLKIIAHAFLDAFRVIATIMTVVAGAMIALNMEQHQRILWNWILGIGLAANFGLFLTDLGFLDVISGAEQAAKVQIYTPKLETINDEHVNIMSQMMNHYRVHVIEPGAKIILPVCMKIMIILTLIQSGYDLAFKLISGDKIKYMLSVVLKLGFMIFLMQNWIGGIGLMHALNTGFETIGYMAGGQGIIDLEPDAICDNAFKIFAHVIGSSSHFSSYIPGVSTILGLLILMASTVLIFLSAIEMFMARMEFYTMAILVMPILPFMMTSKLAFLSDKAIGAMFNLAIKCAVIAFLTSIIIPFFDSFSKQLLETKNPLDHTMIMLQLLLICFLIYLLIKKCSVLVSSLLNGQPAFGGSDMTGTLTGAAATAASTAGAVGRASAVAANGANRTSVFRELAKQAALQGTTVGKAYANARSYNMSSYSGYNGGDRPKTTEEVQREHREAQQRQAEQQKADWDKAVRIANKRLSPFQNK